MIKNPKNQVVWKWKPFDYFPTKNSFVHDDQTCKRAKRNASENDKDWAHANYVGFLENSGNLWNTKQNSEEHGREQEEGQGGRRRSIMPRCLH